MKKQIEEELKAKGYAIVEEDGNVNLYITSELNAKLQNDKNLSEFMVQLIVQKSIQKVIFH
jgi:hypothetical protein